MPRLLLHHTIMSGDLCIHFQSIFREQLSVVFVYDCESCVTEADDPQDAVLYFHPAWVSEQQRLALCGQLMGATHFFLASFSCPRLISLRSGQFAIRQCGRFILVSCALCIFA